MTADRELLALALGHLDAVLDAPPDRRTGVVECLAAGDPALRRELEAMAAAADDTSAIDGGLAAVAPDLLGEITGEPPSGEVDLLGRRFGPWRVVGILGRGGMGVVCHVRRDDHFEMEAALKIVAAGDADPALTERFERERQLLAGLDHPGISRLLDGGVAGDGTPYLVMELVDGVPIDRWCEDHDLDVPHRIELVLEVCDAVAEAHRALVVHRDLKPRNVLVDRSGRVRLLDFGVAAVLDPAMIGDLDPIAPLTPDAAAPEQLRGERVGTDTDVWALGILLYRLLAGASPFSRSRRTRLDELARERTDPVRPPSDAAADAARVRRLRGDLDAIVLRAMHPDRSERYPTVNAMASDLRAWLDGRPVEARPLPAPARLWRHVRRHRVASTSLLIALAAVVAGGAGAAWQARNATLERDRAVAVEEFLVGLFRGADPFGDGRPDLTARELVEAGSAELEDGFPGGDAVEARLAETLGWVWMGLGDADSAQDSFRRALRLAVAAHGESHPRTASIRTGLGTALLRQGAFDEARREIERAVVDLRERGGDRQLARAVDAMARFESRHGRHAAAAELFEEALRLWRRRPEGADSSIASALANLAGQYDYLGRDREAIELTREALEILRQQHGEEHPDVASTLNNLALKLAEAGRIGESVELQRQALEIAERTTPDAPNLAGKFTNLGKLLLDHGRIDEAAPLIEHAAARARKLLPANAIVRLACEANFATLARERGQYEQARREYRSVLERLRRLVGDDHHAVARARSLLADTERLAGRPTEALDLFDRALRRQREPDVNDLNRAESLGGHGLTALRLGRSDAARESLSAALEARRALQLQDDWRGLEYRTAAAALDGRFADARALLDRLATRLGTDHPRVRWLRDLLADLEPDPTNSGGD